MRRRRKVKKACNTKNAASKVRAACTQTDSQQAKSGNTSTSLQKQMYIGGVDTSNTPQNIKEHRLKHGISPCHMVSVEVFFYKCKRIPMGTGMTYRQRGQIIK